jgi:hypothetical protein
VVDDVGRREAVSATRLRSGLYIHLAVGTSNTILLMVDKRGRLLETGPRVQDLFSARLSSGISDLAIISQCIFPDQTLFAMGPGLSECSGR